MTPEVFLREFGSFAEAEGNLTQIRNVVRRLAVTGRLTQREESDHDTVSALPPRAPTRHREELSREAPLIDIPPRWRWLRFDEVAIIRSNLVAPKGHPDLPHVAPDVIEKGTGRLLAYRTIAEDGVTSSKHQFYPGQILYSKIRPNLSKAVIVDFEGLCSADMYPVESLLHPPFLLLFMLSPIFLEQVVREDNRLAMPKVNQQQLNAVWVATPPLAEQKRIVAKVEHVMALCDELEEKQKRKRSTCISLNKAALNAVVTAPDRRALKDSWKRVQDHFEVLYDMPENVKELRQTILQLAVMGKLGTARKDDPHASTLLKDLAANRVRRATELGVRATEAVAAPNRLALPKNWVSIPLDQLGVFLGGGTPSKSNSEFWNGDIPWVTPKDMKRPVIEDSIDHVSPDAVAASSVKWVPEHSLLMVVRGMILAHSFPVARTSRPVTVNQDMKALVLGQPEWAEFLLVVLQAARGRVLDSVERSSHGTCRLESERLRELEIGLPPLVEQTRIVAKVRLLMNMCDELDAKLSLERSTGDQLMVAGVSSMVG